MIPNTLSRAQVVSVDPDTCSLYCYLVTQMGEGPVAPIKVLMQGRCDGININQKQLPKRGTLGIVGAVDGDPRSLVWLGAIPVNQQDAITTISGNQNIEYMSHFSGLFYLIDDAGNTTVQWPDSSSFSVGTSGQPTVHRVIDGERQSVSFPYSSRVPNPPGAFPITLLHATGTYIEIDSEGNLNVSGVKTVNVSGATSVNIFSPNSINMKAPTVSVSGTLYVTGDVLAGQGGGNNISLLNHNHPQGVDSHGDTEQNTGAPVPNT